MSSTNSAASVLHTSPLLLPRHPRTKPSLLLRGQQLLTCLELLTRRDTNTKAPHVPWPEQHADGLFELSDTADTSRY